MFVKLRKIILFATRYSLLATLLCGCATTGSLAPERFKETVVIDGVRYVPSATFSKGYNLDYDWDSIAKRLVLKKDANEVIMMMDSSTALVNNRAKSMEKEARLYRGALAIPQSFAYKTLAPLFKEKYIAEKPPAYKIAGWPIKSVIIDPGHGGKDPGAIGRRKLKEKDVVLDIAKKLKKRLNDKGINVILTRDKDEFISLYQRNQIANKYANDVDFFISIHANAARSRWAHGVEVFYLSESIDDDSRSYKATQKYDLALKEAYSGKDTKRILWDLALTDDRKSSIELAEMACNSLCKNLSQKKRGKKPARFYVLKANIPAILVEVGFISNPAEEKRLRNASYRDKIANSVAESIFQYNRNFAQRSYTAY